MHPAPISRVALLATATVALLAPALADARPVRAGAATSINRPNLNRPGAGGGGIQRNAVNRSGNRINTGNINVGNRNTNINIDNDNGWHHWDDHPIATGVAIGTAAAVTRAVVGSMIYSLPPACAPRPYTGMTYYYCGGVWYEPRYQSDRVVYVVVNQPG